MSRNVVERAFELAQTGRFKTVTEIRAALRAERLESVEPVSPAARSARSLRL